MEHPSERRLSLSLSWSGGSGKRSYDLPLGSFLRVLAVLALCAVSFKAGFWRAQLDREAAAYVAASTQPAVEGRTDTLGAGAPGRPVGEPEDVITPLNVRDPSALVMGPGATEAPPSSEVPPPPPPRLRDWREELRSAADDVAKRESQQHYLSGVVYFQQGKKQKARDEWKLAVQLDPGNSDAKAGLDRLGER
jgi:hypothetical protein